jgi:hypothetical protein
MISSSTLVALCEEAGVDPHYVSAAFIRYDHVSFQMYSQDSWGNKYASRAGEVQTHWVKVMVD